MVTWNSPSWSDVWTWISGWPLRIVAILLVAIIAQVVATTLINRFIERSIRVHGANVNRREAVREDGSIDRTRLLQERHAQRATSIGHLLRSAAIITIWTIAVTMILSTLHVDIAPLLASAGIVGIAVGFGAQALIKDYFSGIAMIMEDQFGVGDVVQVDGVTGTVEEVTLRVTRVRDASGVVWYLRNGEILKVANMSQGWTMAAVDIPVSGDADLNQVRGCIDSMGDTLYADDSRGATLITPPRYAGVERLAGDVITVRVTARTEPGQEVAASRAIRESARSALDKAGLVIPSQEQINDASA